jgi:protein subunit release factor B
MQRLFAFQNAIHAHQRHFAALLMPWLQHQHGSQIGRAFAVAASVRSGDSNITIPRAMIDTNFSRSSGAGGQNVNKVNTKAEIRFKLDDASWIDDEVKERFRSMWSTSINGEGEVYLQAQLHRTQEANLEAAFDKLTVMLRKAAVVPKVRMQRTGLSELTKESRRDDKRHRSQVKTNRKGNFDFNDD